MPPVPIDQSGVPAGVPEWAPVANAPALSAAPIGLRFVNWIVDRLLSFCMGVVFCLIVYFIYKLTLGKNNHLGILGEYLVIFLAYVVFQFFYYYGLEKGFKRTFGKAITGTQVVSEKGGALTHGQVILRTFARLIPFDEFSVFFNQRRTWHDTAGSSMVVKSSSLPAEAQKKGLPMRITAYVLLAPILGIGLLWPLYEQATGGKRIDLPQHMPADLQLVKYDEVSSENGKYYSMTFQGKDRSILMNRQIAGFDFDPDVPCMYMAPTHLKDYGYAQVDSSLVCTSLSPTKDYIQAYVVKATANTVNADNVPDYYIHKPPYRYAIKVLSGKLSKSEVTAMTKDYKTYTAAQLRSLAASNAP